jgi:hypothetical protein
MNAQCWSRSSVHGVAVEGAEVTIDVASWFGAGQVLFSRVKKRVFHQLKVKQTRSAQAPGMTIVAVYACGHRVPGVGEGAEQVGSPGRIKPHL